MINKALLVLVILLVGANAATGFSLWMSHRDAAACAIARDQAVGANKTQEATIQTQRRALDGWAATADEWGARWHAVKQQLAADVVAMADAGKRLHEAEAKDAGLPDCDRFLAVDVARVCPAHWAAARERAQ